MKKKNIRSPLRKIATCYAAAIYRVCKNHKFPLILISQKAGGTLIFSVFSDIFYFRIYINKNQLFFAQPLFLHDSNVTVGKLVLLLVFMVRKYTKVNYGTNYIYVGATFLSTNRGFTTPLVRRASKQRLRNKDKHI